MAGKICFKSLYQVDADALFSNVNRVIFSFVGTETLQMWSSNVPIWPISTTRESITYIRFQTYYCSGIIYLALHKSLYPYLYSVNTNVWSVLFWTLSLIKLSNSRACFLSCFGHDLKTFYKQWIEHTYNMHKSNALQNKHLTIHIS